LQAFLPAQACFEVWQPPFPLQAFLPAQQSVADFWLAAAVGSGAVVADAVG